MLQLRVGATPVDNPRPLDLEAVVRRVCAAKAGPQNEHVVDVSAAAVAVGHEDRLEHVIGHLIQNAIDASTPPGRSACASGAKPAMSCSKSATMGSA